MPKQNSNPGNNDAARAKLEEARSARDKFQQFALLKEAVGIVDDKALQSEIESELSSLTENVIISLKEQVFSLSVRDDYKEFVSALRSLEKWRKSGYEFEMSDGEKIEEARRWFDAKRNREGAGISKAILGTLQEKYVLYKEFQESDPDEEVGYYINVDQKLSYEQYLKLLLNEWREASSDVCGKIMHQAVEIARTSPGAARAFLVDALKEEVDFRFVKTAKVMRIKEYEFDQPEIERIKAYIGLLGTPSGQESEAEDERTNALNAVNLFARYELLLKSREYSWSIPAVGAESEEKIYYLPGLDNLIHETYGMAAEFRSSQIGKELTGIQNEIRELPNLGKGVFDSQFVKISDQLDSCFSEIIAWPGVGQKLRATVNGKSVESVIQRPSELDALKETCNRMIGEVANLRGAYDRLVLEDGNIRELLGSSDVSDRQEGVESFNLIKDDAIISKFLIFENLRRYKIQQTGFDEGEKEILEQYSNENWATVLQLCKDFVSKPTYKEKCPEKIKENISSWRQTASQRLMLSIFQGLVEKENYYSAYRFWERAQDAKMDWQPVGYYLEKVNKVDADGKELFDFYRNWLREFNLSLEHILLRILRNPDEVFGDLEKPDKISAQEKKLVTEILGESAGQYSSEEVGERFFFHLQAHLKNHPFEQKQGLLKKIRYIAGISSSSASGYPPFTPSFAQFEAEKLSGYLTSIVQQEALAALRAVAKSGKESEILAAYARIESIYEFSFLLSPDDSEILKTVEVANAQLRSAQTSPEQALKIWETLKRHFENDRTVNGKYRDAKRIWYITEAQRLRGKKQYPEALKLISEGFDNLGMIWQLYLERAYTCLEMEAFDDARKALNEARKSRRTNDIVMLEIDIDLGEKSSKYRDEPLALMSSLVEYRKGLENNHRRIIERTLDRNYEDFSRRYGLEIKDRIKSAREKAWRPLLDLMKLEEIYLRIKPQTKRSSLEFILQLLPTLYPTGISLIAESEDFNQKIMDHGVELKKCLSGGEQLHDRLVSYEGLLSSLQKGQGDKMFLAEVIRSIINAKVKDQLKREFIRELGSYIIDIEGEAKKNYSEIKENRSRLRQNLDDRLKDCERKLVVATDAVIWFECPSAVTSGERQANAWKSLDDSSEELNDYKNFQEVIKFQSALDNWKATFQDIQKKHEALREDFYEGKTDQAEGLAGELERLFESLPPYSSDIQKLAEIKQIIRQLKSGLTTQNSYTKDDLRGLDAIRNSIAGLKNEISLWQNERTQKIIEVGGFSQRIKQLQEKVSKFKSSDYESHKRFLTEKKAGQLIEEYFGSVNKIDLLKSQETSTLMPYPKPRETSMNNASPYSPHSQNDNADGFIKSFFKSYLAQKPNVNPLLEGIQSSYGIIYPIVEQEAEIKELLSEIEASLKNDQFSLSITSNASEKLNRECDLLINQKRAWETDLRDVSAKNLKCQEKVRYPKERELQEYLRLRQYPKLARRIIDADLIGSLNQDDRDVINAFREILMKAKWT